MRALLLARTTATVDRFTPLAFEPIPDLHVHGERPAVGLEDVRAADDLGPPIAVQIREHRL